MYHQNTQDPKTNYQRNKTPKTIHPHVIYHMFGHRELGQMSDEILLVFAKEARKKNAQNMGNLLDLLSYPVNQTVKCKEMETQVIKMGD